jgi:hypothetical protein
MKEMVGIPYFMQFERMRFAPVAYRIDGHQFIPYSVDDLGMRGDRTKFVNVYRRGYQNEFLVIDLA